MVDATNVLRREHHDIAAVVLMAEEMLLRRMADPNIGIRDMPEMTNFFLRYADHLHHAKEESVLFPAVLRHQPESLTLLDVLLEEHQQIRAILATLEQALSRGQRDAYFETVRAYIAVMHQHLAREEGQLLPLADQLFSPEEQQQLAAQLAAVQEERMPSTEVSDWQHWSRQAATVSAGSTTK